MSYLEKLQYSFDWLNGTLPYYDVRAFFNDLEKIHPDLRFEDFHSRCRGIYNYSQSFGLMGDARFIVAFNPDYEYEDSFSDAYTSYPLQAVSSGYNPGIFISISGDGLRYLNSLGDHVVADLFAWLQKCNFKASRLDVACDIFESDNPIIPLLIEAFYYAINRQGGCPTLVSNMRRTPETIKIMLNADPYRDNNNYSHSISFGHHGSSWGMFRMYDKWLEVKTGRLKHFADELLKDKDYWYRIEYELHKQHAADLFNRIGELTTAECFGYAAEDMFKIVVPISEKTQSDKCDSSPVWVEFIEFVTSNIFFI